MRLLRHFAPRNDVCEISVNPAPFDNLNVDNLTLYRLSQLNLTKGAGYISG
jgi:hypothetical protein